VGVGMTALGRFPERSVKDLTREAVLGALADAGLRMEDIQEAWFANTRQGLLEGQNVIRGQCALRSMGFETIAMTNVENACASSSSALREAVAHIKAGLCDIALVVGADKMFFADKRDEMFRAFLGGTDVHETDALLASLRALDGVPVPEDVKSAIGLHSLFMDIYAAIARLHMKAFGTTMRQIACAASKNHFHSTRNPLSQYRHEIGVDEVLADPLVSWPLTRAMCAPISDGAAAAVVCSGAVLGRVGCTRAVKVAASALKTGSNRDPLDFDRHIGRIAALAAYEAAGIGPEDVDVAEVHDACAFAEILQIENLGLCARGEGGPFTESGMTTLGGRVPVNPSGGLVSKGHPVAATGLIQLVELVTQLRGEAGSRQVPDARVAVAENGGGFWGLEEAATLVTVLTRA
jgi:acetyl-CoA acetyltransferase